MIKRKFTRKQSKATDHRLYVIKFWLDSGDIIYKIGYTSKTVEQRLLQILASFLTVHGYSPRAKIVQREIVKGGFAAEQELHRRFNCDRCKQDENISGFSEFFKLDIDKLTVQYWDVIEHMCTAGVDRSTTYKKNLLY